MSDDPVEERLTRTLTGRATALVGGPAFAADDVVVAGRSIRRRRRIAAASVAAGLVVVTLGATFTFGRPSALPPAGPYPVPPGLVDKPAPDRDDGAPAPHRTFPPPAATVSAASVGLSAWAGGRIRRSDGTEVTVTLPQGWKMDQVTQLPDGYWRIGTDGLARGRFTVSALAQTLEALGTLAHGDPAPGRHAWARVHRPAFQQRIAADPTAAALVRESGRPRWIADFITMPPRRSDRTFHGELRQVRQAPVESVRRDLSAHGTLDRALRGADVAQRCADLLEWVWIHTVRPDWPRLRQILEADVLSRTQRLATHGWAAALDGLRPGTRWLGDGRPQINTYDNPPKEITDAELMFIPCVARRGWISWDEPDRYAVVYPCAGVLADAGAVKPPDALARLIGANRGAILMALAEPLSTSQLVALKGYGLGSVGGHLKVMLDADLIARRRVGRSVVYYRTSIGDALAG